MHVKNYFYLTNTELNKDDLFSATNSLVTLKETMKTRYTNDFQFVIRHPHFVFISSSLIPPIPV